MPSLWSLRFKGLAAPVILPTDAGLLDALRQCVRNWDFSVSMHEPAVMPDRRPVCILEPRGEGRFRAHSLYLDKPLDALCGASAICAVLADLSQAFADLQDCHEFGLHCGGVTLGSRTIILAGERRAGKSTLVARLACDPGVEVLGDDVLPIDRSGQITGLGLAPRLRLPLPEGASRTFRDYVKAHLGPADSRYGYLLTPALAPHGRHARAEVFILLDRRPDAPARLHHLHDGELLQAIIARSIAGPDGPEAVLNAAETLAAGLVGVRLVYSDLEDAARLLHRAFAGAEGPEAPAIHIAPPLPPASAPQMRGPAPVSPHLRLARAPETAIRQISGAAFLWRPDGAMLWHLNPAALAIWTLLETPGTALEIADTLTEIFPDVDPPQLLHDAIQLLAQLCEEGFVIPAAV